MADKPNLTEHEQEALVTLRAIELARCAADKLYWFDNWVWTFNPKLVGASNPWIPMDLYPRQREAIRWFEDRSRLKEDGHFAKSRDIGFTWMAGGYALHRWLFEDGYKANFGSRKAEYVDRIGDPDSIFEKIRMLYRALPEWMLPARMSDNSMLLVNEDRGSIIRGEAGDDMGRGGRSTDYFFDEFAFVERADSVDAASVANADCRIFGSTVNGQGNLFFRKAHDGNMKPHQLFRFHWTDDPRKANGTVTQDDGTVVSWEKATRSKMEAHKWASEYDIDYAASVEGICIEAKWVEAAKRIRVELLKRGIMLPVDRYGVAGGDVGAGKAKSVLVPRFGVDVRVPHSWTEPDTVNTANRMIMFCEREIVKDNGFEGKIESLRFDTIGVGEGVGSVLTRSTSGLSTYAVRAGDPASETKWTDGRTGKDKFANVKAESWWAMREAFKNTYEHLCWMNGEKDHEGNLIGQEHALDTLISLPPDSAGPDAMALNAQLSLVKWGTQVGGRIIIESKESLAKRGISSPDYADALALTFVPLSTAEKLMRAYA